MSYRRLYRRGAARRSVTRRRDGNTRLSRVSRAATCACACVCMRARVYVHKLRTHTQHARSCSLVVVSFLAVARYLIFASSPLCRGENRRKLNGRDNKGPVRCTYVHAVRLHCTSLPPASPRVAQCTRHPALYMHVYARAMRRFYGRFSMTFFPCAKVTRRSTTRDKSLR